MTLGRYAVNVTINFNENHFIVVDPQAAFKPQRDFEPRGPFVSIFIIAYAQVKSIQTCTIERKETAVTNIKNLNSTKIKLFAWKSFVGR